MWLNLLFNEEDNFKNKIMILKLIICLILYYMYDYILYVHYKYDHNCMAYIILLNYIFLFKNQCIYVKTQ